MILYTTKNEDAKTKIKADMNITFLANTSHGRQLQASNSEMATRHPC